jgi:hypothetical protein
VAELILGKFLRGHNFQHGLLEGPELRTRRMQFLPVASDSARRLLLFFGEEIETGFLIPVV